MIEIAWDNFTPWSALAGGIIIGLSAAGFILLNGRIAGISGILGGLLVPQKRDVFWRIAFLAGMFVAPLLWMMTAELPPIEIKASYPVLVAAGLLVGIGTRYGSGCTSGHGVCGLSRLSARSLIATLTFMVAGFVTVYIIRHLITGA
ncbi:MULTISPECIES: YeeE/YedE family protein [Marinobacter]|uniref:YeeE/YedE family protein n=1 Tax=Marinobacter TaxID=2742 RepID=UPI001246A4A5|nr:MULTISPECIES: YeeE/YedE family protein [Marinobacter]MBL3556838.1 YeeE/YedE family protein [Marinobacter sp. JB05H06]